MNGATGVRWAAGLGVLAGLWILISPWALAFWGVGTATGNNLIVGIAILVLAAIAYSGPEEMWASWVNFILGIWLIVSPYVLGFSMFGRILGNNIISGIVVAVLAIIALSVPTVVSPTYRTWMRRGPIFTGTLPTPEELRRRQETEPAEEEEHLRREREEQDRRGDGPR